MHAKNPCLGAARWLHLLDELLDSLNTPHKIVTGENPCVVAEEHVALVFLAPGCACYVKQHLMQLLTAVNTEGVARVDGQDRIEFLVRTRNAVVAPMLQVGGCASNAPHIAN